MRWKLKTATIASLLLCLLPSCTALETMATGDSGRVVIHADALGMAELSNLLAANAQIAKDRPDLKGASWQLREEQEKTRALRFTFKKRGQQ